MRTTTFAAGFHALSLLFLCTVLHLLRSWFWHVITACSVFTLQSSTFLSFTKFFYPSFPPIITSLLLVIIFLCYGLRLRFYPVTIVLLWVYGSPFPYFHRTVPEFYITLPCVIRKPPAWFWFALSDWPSFLFTPLFPVFRWSVLFLLFLVSPMAWIASSVVRVHLINEDKLPW